jgi:ABC-type lipoprotein release transport system permease subunit
MFTLIYAEIVQGFKRIWKLYLTNILSIMIIILLFAYIDGSRRQLNLQYTAYSGEVVLKLKEIANKNPVDINKILSEKIPSISYISKKIRSEVQYRFTGNNNSGDAEMIGVNLKQDHNLRNYLTLTQGKLIENEKEILVPSSMLQKTDIKIGDSIRISGKTAQDVYNAAAFKVAGIYNSPGLTLFSTPQFLISYASMEAYYMPEEKNLEYCIYFKNGKVPSEINKFIRDALDDDTLRIVDSVEIKKISSWDILNISVQFNIFLIVMIILTTIILMTITIAVNFNIYLILLRKRQKQIGTLMSFGVSSWKIGLTLLLEALVQVIISTVVAALLCYLISFLLRQQIAGGFLEVLFVLLSGTNRIDFYVQFYQISNAFLILLGAVAVSQIPLFGRLLVTNPINMLKTK